MANKRILDVVDSPADLKLLTDDELSILAREIREQIITTTSKTGGHVASSLGAVEIILAVHSLLNCPEDKFIFDVGHQSYAHKLVTGRRDRFDTPRLCAAAGVPYFLLVEIHRGEVAVELHKLVDGSYVEAARATGGERFVTPEPFPLNFDPAELLAGRATR